MGISDTFCQLGDLVEEWERGGVTVRSTTITDETGLGRTGRLTAEVTLAVPFADAGRNGPPTVYCSPELTEEGTITLEVETDLAVPPTGHRVDVEPLDATVDPEGTVLVTVVTTVEPADSGGEGDVSGGEPRRGGGYRAVVGEEGSGTPSVTAGSDPDGVGRSADVPPFKNRALLEEVYERHDTFAEMADALEMDVTGETVRRYMIDHGIHQPNSYRRERSDADDVEHEEEAVVLSDGIGLPENVRVEDVIETVNSSNTIHEVKNDLGLERGEAHTMLKDLNLIDLVLGRLSNDTGREITREDVIERLREVSAQQQ